MIRARNMLAEAVVCRCVSLEGARCGGGSVFVPLIECKLAHLYVHCMLVCFSDGNFFRPFPLGLICFPKILAHVLFLKRYVLLPSSISTSVCMI